MKQHSVHVCVSFLWAGAAAATAASGATGTGATCNSANAIMYVNFDKWEEGREYTLDQLRADFGAGVKTNKNFDHVHVVNGGSGSKGNALRIDYPKGCVGSKCGLWFRAPLNGAYEEIKVSYRVKFNTDFAFVKGGKLPGVCGGTCNSGRNPSNGYNGFSARSMWRKEGRLVSYLYHPDQEKEYGTDIAWQGEASHATPGRWQTITQRVRMNTPGKKNGVLQVWVNGAKVLDRRDINWRRTSVIMADAFTFASFYGGRTGDFAPPYTTTAMFDEFSVCAN